VGVALQNLASQKAPVQLVFESLRLSVAARTAEAGRGKLVFDLLAAPTPRIPVASACCVSFLRQGQPWLFMTRVLSIAAKGRSLPPRIAVRTPSFLACTERRRSVRLKVPETVELRATLATISGRHVPVVPLELSLAGMLVETFDETDAELHPGAPLVCALELGELRGLLRGEVGYRQGTRCAVFFPDAVKSGELKPPDVLVKMYRLVESAWLSALGA